MPTFTYEATDEKGEAAKGSLKADDSGTARRLLTERGLRPTTVKAKTSVLQLEIGNGVPRQEVMHFSRQLAAFVKAGIPVTDAISAIAEGIENARLKAALLDIVDGLVTGQTFQEAISAHPKIFPPFYLGMMQAAELTGNLDETLTQVSRYIERDIEARKKMTSAMTYPAVILAMSIVTIVVLTAFVLPRFRTFFDTLNAELPLPTRILLGVTDFLTTWWFLVVGGIVLALVLLVAWRRSVRGRYQSDALLLKLPVLGETIRFAVIERFCRVLSSMVAAGVPLPEAMTVASQGTNNRVYQRALDGAREEMMRGEGLARPITQTGLFPVAATQMLRVGEDTGSLDAQLGNAAEFYETELDYKIKSFTALFEPAILLFVGLVVGFVAVALVSAMYGIFRQSGNI